MRFPTSHEAWRDLYLLQVEGSVNGLQFAARCYLKSIMGNVEAVILGGQNRLARQSETIWMNGSMSYDLSKRRGDIQFSIYNWNCYSVNDIDNPFCHRNISSGEMLSQTINMSIIIFFQ